MPFTLPAPTQSPPQRWLLRHGITFLALAFLLTQVVAYGVHRRALPFFRIVRDVLPLDLQSRLWQKQPCSVTVLVPFLLAQLPSS